MASPVLHTKTYMRDSRLIRLHSACHVCSAPYLLTTCSDDFAINGLNEGRQQASIGRCRAKIRLRSLFFLLPQLCHQTSKHQTSVEKYKAKVRLLSPLLSSGLQQRPHISTSLLDWAPSYQTHLFSVVPTTVTSHLMAGRSGFRTNSPTTIPASHLRWHTLWRGLVGRPASILPSNAGRNQTATFQATNSSICWVTSMRLQH